jgi:hypothetical protein
MAGVTCRLNKPGPESSVAAPTAATAGDAQQSGINMLTRFQLDACAAHSTTSSTGSAISARAATAQDGLASVASPAPAPAGAGAGNEPGRHGYRTCSRI